MTTLLELRRLEAAIEDWGHHPCMRTRADERLTGYEIQFRTLLLQRQLERIPAEALLCHAAEALPAETVPAKTVPLETVPPETVPVETAPPEMVPAVAPVDMATTYERTHWLILAELCTMLAGVAAVPPTQSGMIAQTLREAGPVIRKRLDTYLRTHAAVTARRDLPAMTAFVDNVRESKRHQPGPPFAFLFA
jgi:hypothetical protein